jgi:hypothetical protein
MGFAQTYRFMAGAFVLLTTALGIWVHPGFLWVTLFIGANLLQSGVTDWCPLMVMLRRAGLMGCRPGVSRRNHARLQWVEP